MEPGEGARRLACEHVRVLVPLLAPSGWMTLCGGRHAGGPCFFREVSGQSIVCVHTPDATIETVAQMFNPALLIDY